MDLKLSISTGPNDTFMFDALVHGRIDTSGYRFQLCMEDIQQLNRHILDGEPDVSKISYAVYPRIADRYRILSAGSALGRGNGPLLVSRHKIYPDEVSDVRIAVPGIYTTANFLLNFAFGEVKERREYLFSDIAEAVLSGEMDAGVLIHEERFSYAQKGLSLVSDLGEVWERKTGLPIPLGAIVVRRELEERVQRDIDSLLRESIIFAMNNPSASYDFVKRYARELSDTVIRRHIEMFVNNFSVDIGEEGRKAVRTLFRENGFESDNCF